MFISWRLFKTRYLLKKPLCDMWNIPLKLLSTLNEVKLFPKYLYVKSRSYYELLEDIRFSLVTFIFPINANMLNTARPSFIYFCIYSRTVWALIIPWNLGNHLKVNWNWGKLSFVIVSFTWTDTKVSSRTGFVQRYKFQVFTMWYFMRISFNSNAAALFRSSRLEEYCKKAVVKENVHRNVQENTCDDVQFLGLHCRWFVKNFRE